MYFPHSLKDLEGINGDIPDDYYFPYFADMAIRARRILENKNASQIYNCARFLRFLIKKKFEELDRDEALNHGRMDVDYIPLSQIISEVSALELDLADRLGPSDFDPRILPDVVSGDDGEPWHRAEFFAVLTLQLLVEATKFYNLSEVELFSGHEDSSSVKEHKLRTISMSDEEVEIERLDQILRVNMPGAAMCALKAMEAVNHGERIKREHDLEMAERERKSAFAGELNIARHQKTRDAKLRVTAEWEVRRNQFQSAAKAGNFYADWLVSEGLKSHEPSTVTNWIRNYAKQKGIKLR